jgi:hypothetical protein
MTELRMTRLPEFIPTDLTFPCHKPFCKHGHLYFNHCYFFSGALYPSKE